LDSCAANRVGDGVEIVQLSNLFFVVDGNNPVNL
jgi:hypothetical protein